jgi:tetratricopeptide (TPR) repeat protein
MTNSPGFSRALVRWPAIATFLLQLALASIFAANAWAQFRGDEYYEQGLNLREAKRFREALAYFTKAIELDDRNADAYYERGIVYQELGELGKSLSDLTTAISKKSDSDYFYERGKTWYKLEDWNKAIADFDEAVRINPGNSDAIGERGLTWHAKGDYERAITDYDYALRLNSKDEIVFFNRGLAYRDKDRHEKAIQDFTAAIRIKPDYSSAYVWRSNSLRKLSDFEKALADLASAFRYAPSDPFVFNDAAWFRATCPNAAFRDGKKAVTHAKRACELTSWKNPNYVDTLAAAYAQAGDFAEATKWSKESLKLDPANQVFERHLAQFERQEALRE